METLELREVSVTLRGETLIGPLSHTVAPGEILTVMGPSGSGKSTLLAVISGFLDPVFSVSGSILLGSQDIGYLPPERRQMGILFQDDLLFPHLSVGGNLAFGLPRGGSRAWRRHQIDNALKEAGLSGFFDRDPSTLSGGQRARVALLRTLLAEPRALLLDEPFSTLDRSLRGEIRGFVFAHARERTLPTLLVTHDEEDATAAGGAVITL
ncbi:MAG TPA: ATP-binding cassette domain-containing protein [Microvirga sp.]|jgi:putative thiamine transport system ATP-binding protein|nr:ATP-binding cassette domain-containing protein [Microvirga sp.]